MHQVHGPKCVVEPIVDCAGVHEVAQAQLADASQALDPRMVEDFREISMSNLNESINRIVEQLRSGSHGRNLARFFATAAVRQNNCDELPLKES